MHFCTQSTLQHHKKNSFIQKQRAESIHLISVDSENGGFGMLTLFTSYTHAYVMVALISRSAPAFSRRFEVHREKCSRKGSVDVICF